MPNLAKTAPFKIASWNINSINVRIEHLLNVLKDYDLDVLAIQETKSRTINSPLMPLPKPATTRFLVVKKAIMAPVLSVNSRQQTQAPYCLAWKRIHNVAFSQPNTRVFW